MKVRMKNLFVLAAIALLAGGIGLPVYSETILQVAVKGSDIKAIDPHTAPFVTDRVVMP